MDTKTYSEFIMKSLDSIDKKIEELADGSVNKEHLHKAVHMQLIIRVKKLFVLSSEDYEKALDHIFKTELNIEIARMWTKHYETGFTKVQ